MKKYVFENANASIRVDFLVDAFEGRFTVMQVQGLSDAEKVLGIQFGNLAYNKKDFYDFAVANNLKLMQITPDSSTTIVAIGTALAISNATSLAGGNQNVVYTPVTLLAVGGNAPFTFAVTTGTLPTGLTLSSAGVISGTPTGTGTSNFTVTATDSFGQTVAKVFSIVVGA